MGYFGVFGQLALNTTERNVANKGWRNVDGTNVFGPFIIYLLSSNANHSIDTIDDSESTAGNFRLRR